jgi:hypothetical protein
MEKELEDLVAIIETIECTDDNAYMQSIREEGQPVVALAELRELQKSVKKIIEECADDVKEIDQYRVYKRYSRCIARELVLIQKVVDSMEVARV